MPSLELKANRPASIVKIRGPELSQIAAIFLFACMAIASSAMASSSPQASTSTTPLSSFFNSGLESNYQKTVGANITGMDTNKYLSFEVKINQGDQSVRIDVPKASNEELAKFHPQKTFAEHKRQHEAMKKHCAGVPGVIKQTLHEFPTEVVAFNLALGAGAGMSISDDPAALRHFYETSLRDPIAHIAFLGFMLGNRGAIRAFQWAGLMYDPCREFKKTPMHATVPPPRAFQKAFAPLAPLLGMSAGMTVSSMLHEFLADPDVRQCIRGFLPDADKEQTQNSCSAAYENFVLGADKKIYHYVPDMITMSITSLIQGYAINTPVALAIRKLKTVGATAAIKQNTKSILIKNFRLLFEFGSRVLPQGGWVAKIGRSFVNLLVFFEINDLILPHVSMWWNKDDFGDDLAELRDYFDGELDRTVKQNWNWTPTQIDPDCQGIGDECEFNPSLTATLEKYATKKREWRQFLLMDASIAFQNWQDYVTRLMNTYSGARNFYWALTQELYLHKSKPNAPRALFDHTPVINGFNLPSPGQLCTIIEDNGRRQFAPQSQDIQSIIYESKVLLEKEIHQEISSKPYRHPKYLKWMQEIMAGLEAGDCTKPYAPSKEAIRVFRLKNKRKPTLADLITVDNEVRIKPFLKAMASLEEALRDATGNRIGSVSLDVDHPEKYFYPQTSMFAEGAANIFVKLGLLFNNPEPMTKGETVIRAIDQAKSVFDQELKTLHPGSVRWASTPAMADYMLAQMICGPSEKSDFVASNLGFSINFVPPRLINDVGVDFCKTVPDGFDARKMTYDIYKSTWSLKDKKFQGFIDVFEKHARADIVNAKQNNFLEWWEQEVDPQMLATLKELRTKYEKIINDKVIPRIASRDVVEYGRRGRKLFMGTGDSLRDEMEFYLKTLEKTYSVAKVPLINDRRVKDELKVLQKQFDRAVRFFQGNGAMIEAVVEMEADLGNEALNHDGSVDRCNGLSSYTKKRAQEAWDGNLNLLQKSFAQLGELIQSTTDSTIADEGARKALAETRVQVAQNMNGLLSELESYFGFLRTLKLAQLSGDEEMPDLCQ